MNPNPNREVDALRSDIELTRQRMDDTMDALTERFQGRHLLDEIIGFFRGGDASASGAQVREMIAKSAGTASHAVVDTVKKNPLPILLMTAGAAWLAYSISRGRREDADLSSDENERFDPDTHFDRPIHYPTGGESFASTGEEGDESRFQHLRDTVGEKAAGAKEQLKQKWSDLSEGARSKFESARERMGELGQDAREHTREVYERSRDRVAEAVDEHPLGVGLGCLAAGMLIGLALPTPAPVNRLAGTTMDRLKSRTRDAGREAVEKGRHVVRAAASAATTAARDEAEAQGLATERKKENGATPAAPTSTPLPADTGMAGTPGTVMGGAADPSLTRPGM
ncbi:DUF3618 domain-containing protein [Opitutus sp. ER46]|uniref:DUF883 family protein n=1 Tax=Opitutus sp. ER46 TaxID=2161864 RepID=UPI000D32012C|nr:DUF3618 domain-containing protein [Opitutus sp. ER46]PTX97837.1 hypothetical protein DB354_06045 [Opitutus sp. ER46]